MFAVVGQREILCPLEGWGWKWGFCRAARNIGTGQALLDADDT